MPLTRLLIIMGWNGMEIFHDRASHETRENRLEELVIAIDTSGSCKEMVARFLGETRRILEEKENFFENWKVCLIQCDSLFREKVMIHSARMGNVPGTVGDPRKRRNRFSPGVRGSRTDAGEKRIQRPESTDLFHRR